MVYMRFSVDVRILCMYNYSSARILLRFAKLRAGRDF
jgi:hypothetical protein